MESAKVDKLQRGSKTTITTDGQQSTRKQGLFGGAAWRIASIITPNRQYTRQLKSDLEESGGDRQVKRKLQLPDR